MTPKENQTTAISGHLGIAELEKWLRHHENHELRDIFVPFSKQ